MRAHFRTSRFTRAATGNPILLNVLMLIAGGILAGCGGMRSTVLQLETKQALAAPSPLMPFVRACREPGTLIGREGFGVLHLTPPFPRHFRPVFMGKEKDSVSVETGHRIMYGYEDAGYFFANVKIERSDSGHYTRDKEVLFRQARVEEKGTSYQEPRLVNGLEVIGIERDTLDVGGVIGMYTAFLDRGHMVVTAYLLNQEKKKRRFRTMEEYRALRDRFLDDLTACVISGARAGSGEP